MIKKKMVLTTVLSLLLLAACDDAQEGVSDSSGADASTAELESRLAELEAENAELRAALEDDAETAEEVDAEEDPEDEAEVEEVEESSSGSEGTRSDPFQYGETANLYGTFVDRDADRQEFDAELAMTVVDTIRGDEAWEIILNENQFNDPAPEGKEYIINRVRIELSNATSDDLKTNFNYREFDYISAGGSSYSYESVVLPDELNVELFNDGQAEGNIVGLIDVDDSPLLRFNNTLFFESE